MFCPNCGVEIASENVQFCVKCGNDLFGSNATVKTGNKQSLVLFAIGILLIPIWMFIGAAFPPNDRLVESAPSTTVGESIAWIAMWMAFIAAAARFLYALVFQRNLSGVSSDATNSALPRRNTSYVELSAGDTFEPAPAGKWKTTSDLKMPAGFQQRTSDGLK